MRDYELEFAKRVQYIRELVESSGVDGIVFGNSGGKDSALVGILCKFACENTVGVMMPCASKVNFGKDMEDAKELARSLRPMTDFGCRPHRCAQSRDRQVICGHTAFKCSCQQYRSETQNDNAVHDRTERVPIGRRHGQQK